MFGTLFMIYEPEKLKQKFNEEDVLILIVLLVFT